VALSERVRTRVEAFGRVKLQDTEAAALVQSKAVHVVLILAVVPAGVWINGSVFPFFAPFLVVCPPRDSDPHKLFMGPKDIYTTLYTKSKVNC
jgi:hypothetical protein